ncbi:MAG: YgaP family membrane protein [Desulfobulbaceae bacterium]
MKQNVGSVDQKIRLGIGSILFLIGLFAPVSIEWRVAILAVAVIAMVTAAVSF